MITSGRRLVAARVFGRVSDCREKWVLEREWEIFCEAETSFGRRKSRFLIAETLLTLLGSTWEIFIGEFL